MYVAFDAREPLVLEEEGDLALLEGPPRLLPGCRCNPSGPG